MTHAWPMTSAYVPSGRSSRPNFLLPSRGSAIVLFLSVLSLSSIGGSALKHNFKTKHDERSLIGPIGFPFGFVAKGI